jgi:hypothetical protein
MYICTSIIKTLENLKKCIANRRAIMFCFYNYTVWDVIGRCFRQPHFSGVYVLANGCGTELAELLYNIDTRGNHGKPTILWLYNGISATKRLWSICVISPAMGLEPTTYWYVFFLWDITEYHPIQLGYNDIYNQQHWVFECVWTWGIAVYTSDIPKVEIEHKLTELDDAKSVSLTPYF